MTRAAFGGSQKAHALDFKLHPDERIQIHFRRDDISPRDAGRFAADTELAAKFFKNFRREKGDLALVVVLEIKEAVALDAAAGHAADFRALDQRAFARRLFVVAEEIMPRRNVEMADFHNPKMTVFKPTVKAKSSSFSSSSSDLFFEDEDENENEEEKTALLDCFHAHRAVLVTRLARMRIKIRACQLVQFRVVHRDEYLPRLHRAGDERRRHQFRAA